MYLLWGRKNINTGAYGAVLGVDLLFVGHSVVNKKGEVFVSKRMRDENGEIFIKSEFVKFDHIISDEKNVRFENTIFTDLGMLYTGEVVLYRLDGTPV